MFKKTKIFFFNYFLKVLNFLPPKYSCSLSNFRQIIMNRKVRFFYLKDLNLYKVKSDNLSMYFFTNFGATFDNPKISSVTNI